MPTTMNIISRKEAKSVNLKRYFTGVPCRFGHLSERRVSNGHCIECKQNVDKSGRPDGKEYQPNVASKSSLPIPPLDDINMIDLAEIGLTTVGLENDRPLTKQEWICLVQVADRARSFRQWLIGDLWNQFGWGSKAVHMEAHGINPTSAQEYGRVCSRIPADMRRPNVPFSKHQELCVQAVKDDAHMVMLLDRIEVDNMTVKEIRKMVGSYKDQLARQTGEVASEDQFKALVGMMGKVKRMDVVPAEVLKAAETFQAVLDEFLK